MPRATRSPAAGPASPPPAGLRLAPRPAALAGLRVGLMDNAKDNAALLLAEIGALLAAEYGASVTLAAAKSSHGALAPAELIEEYRSSCDAVITGVGDCASGSASAAADGIRFERAGVPAAVICSERFAVTAKAMAQLRGAPGYRCLATGHPVGGLTSGQVRLRARQLLPQVVAALTRGPDSPKQKEGTS